jgi:flagellar biosynthesis protein FliR
VDSASLANWIASCLVLGMRVAPVFAFAPPFTLIRMPALFRLLFGLGLSATLVAAHPETAVLAASNLPAVAEAAARELGLGLVLVLAFQIAFGALYVAGRTVDIQAGYGLASLIDPTSQSQLPFVGTLFAYAAGAVFFAFDGHIALLRLFAASVDIIPIGSWAMPHSIERMTAFISIAFVTAFGVAGGAIVVLFLIDMAIAFLSRTVPQMNVLILGFQVKSIVLYLALPASFGMGGVLLARLMTMTLEAIPRLT